MNIIFRKNTSLILIFDPDKDLLLFKHFCSMYVIFALITLYEYRIDFPLYCDWGRR